MACGPRAERDEVTIRNVARRAATRRLPFTPISSIGPPSCGVRKLARGRFEAALDKATSMLDGCARVLDFAVAFPRDYELLFGYGYRERADPDRQVAEFAAFEGHIRQAGVREPDVRPTALAIASLLHGTAMFQLSQKAPDERWQEFRSATLDACATLLAAKSVGPAKPTRSRTRWDAGRPEARNGACPPPSRPDSRGGGSSTKRSSRCAPTISKHCTCWEPCASIAGKPRAPSSSSTRRSRSADHARTWCNRGNALFSPRSSVRGSGKVTTRRSRSRRPMSTPTTTVATSSTRWDADNDAVASYDRLLALRPDHAEAHSNRGVVLFDLGRFDDAVASYDKAIALQPDNAALHANRANALRQLRRFEEAVAGYDRAIALRSDANALCSRGNALYEWVVSKKRSRATTGHRPRPMTPTPGRARLCPARSRAVGGGGESYRRAIALDPAADFLFGEYVHTKMQACDWAMHDGDVAGLASRIAAGRRATSPFIALALLDDPALHRRASDPTRRRDSAEPRSRVRSSGTPSPTGSDRLLLGRFSRPCHGLSDRRAHREARPRPLRLHRLLVRPRPTGRHAAAADRFLRALRRRPREATGRSSACRASARHRYRDRSEGVYAGQQADPLCRPVRARASELSRLSRNDRRAAYRLHHRRQRGHPRRGADDTTARRWFACPAATRPTTPGSKSRSARRRARSWAWARASCSAASTTATRSSRRRSIAGCASCRGWTEAGCG